MLTGMRKQVISGLVFFCMLCTCITNGYGNNLDEGINPEIIALMGKIKDAKYEIVLKDGTKYKGKVEILENGLLLETAEYKNLKEFERQKLVVSFDEIKSIRVIKRTTRWMGIYLVTVGCLGALVACIAGV